MGDIHHLQKSTCPLTLFSLVKQAVDEVETQIKRDPELLKKRLKQIESNIKAWDKLYDENSQNFYYQHVESGQSQWEQPDYFSCS